jgi:hypothetical protein
MEIKYFNKNILNIIKLWIPPDLDAHTMTCLYGELGQLDESAEGSAQRLPVRHAHLVVAEPAHQPVEVLHVAHGGGEVLHVLGVLRTREEGQCLLPVGDNFCTTKPNQGFSVSE